MMIQVFTILLVFISSILCSGTQQGVSSTQAGQTLQIQPNVRKYNKHTVTEKPCTTGSTTGTRKDKPDSSDAQDYVPIGNAGYPYQYPPPYPYPYPYPYQPVGPLVVPGGTPYRPQYPYELQYPAETTPPYYHHQGAPPPYAGYPYPPAAYPAVPPQQLYEQSSVVDAYRSPLPPYLLQQQPAAEQPQFFRQPVAAPYYPYYAPQQSSTPHYRAHGYNRPGAATPPAFLQQRDAAATAAAPIANNAAEPQYEQQQSGPFDGNQFHY